MTAVWCNNSDCKHNAGGRGCKLKEVRLNKTWEGTEKNWRLLCLDTTDRTYRHPKEETNG